VGQPDDAERTGPGLDDRGGRQADVGVGAEQRVGQQGGRGQQRRHPVVELVVPGGRGGDRQLGHVGPRAFAEQRNAGPTVKSPASSQTVGWRSRSRSSSSATPAQVPPSP
jgi:hypothetical protein